MRIGSKKALKLVLAMLMDDQTYTNWPWAAYDTEQCLELVKKLLAKKRQDSKEKQNSMHELGKTQGQAAGYEEGYVAAKLKYDRPTTAVIGTAEEVIKRKKEIKAARREGFNEALKEVMRFTTGQMLKNT